MKRTHISTETSSMDILRKTSIYLLLLSASFLLYCNSISNQFVFDDISLIVNNPLITSFENIFQIIGLKDGKPLYRPVRYITYLVDYAVSGLGPLSYHISNIVYHSITAFVLFVLLRLLTGSTVVSLAGSLLFTAHPVHTESVAYISGRRDILCTLFFLTGFYSFVRYRQTNRIIYVVLVFASFLLAVGAKEMAVTLPVICMLYDFVFMYKKKPQSKHELKHFKKLSFAPYFFLTGFGLFYLYYKLVLHYPSLVREYYGGNFLASVATVCRVIVRYIKLVFFPVLLHADYSFNAFSVSRSFFEKDVLLSCAFLVILIVLTVYVRTRHKLVFFGSLWFFITLLPVCHIFPHHEIMAEHYLYLPSIGIIILLSPLWKYFFEAKPKQTMAIVGVILLLFSVRTVFRNRDWKDPFTVWSKVVQTTPACARAHDNLGSEYLNRNEHNKALYHYRKAVKLRPWHAVFRNNLGMAHRALGNTDAAQQEFTEAIRIAPRFAPAHNNLGIVYMAKGKLKKAEAAFRKTIKKNPRLAEPRNNLGIVYGTQGKLKKAERAFRNAIKRNPAMASAYVNLGLVLVKQGKIDEAIPLYNKALRLKPGDTRAHANLQKALMIQKRIRGAAG